MDNELLIAENNALRTTNELLVKQLTQVLENQAKLQHQLDLLLKQVYGRRSERFVPQSTDQPNLFSDLEPVQAAEPIEEKQESTTETITYERKKSNHKGRQLLEGCEHLPVRKEIVEIEVGPDDVKIGEEITRKLAVDTVRLYVRQIIRFKYKNTQTSEIKIAPMPNEAILKCEADETLLAHIAISKFVDHTPEYRQQQIFKRQGVSIPPSTMNNWTHQVAALIKPLAHQIQSEILQSNYIQMDESTIKVLFVKKDKTHKGYLWVMIDPQTKNTYFEYQEGRGREGPLSILKHFKGKLQTDGYTVYKIIDAIMEAIDHYNCWAHARRKFVEAESNDKKLSTEILLIIQKLYEVEEKCRKNGLDNEARKQIRQEESIPILAKIKDWLDTKALITTPSSPMGKAMAYSVNRWENLVKYASTGDVEIDNNWVENAIRPLALGRKNYLFAGGHEAAQNIAYFYTIFGTCKAMDINPNDYLLWYLKNVPTLAIKNIGDATPAAYKKSLSQKGV